MHYIACIKINVLQSLSQDFLIDQLLHSFILWCIQLYKYESITESSCAFTEHSWQSHWNVGACTFLFFYLTPIEPHPLKQPLVQSNKASLNWNSGNVPPPISLCVITKLKFTFVFCIKCTQDLNSEAHRP